MRKRLRGTPEPQALADIISARLAEIALRAGQADFQRDSIAGSEMRHLGADGADDAGRLVAKGQGLADKNIAIAVMREVVEIRAAEARSLDCDLGLERRRRAERAMFLGGQMEDQNKSDGLTILRSRTPCRTDALTFRGASASLPVGAIFWGADQAI